MKKHNFLRITLFLFILVFLVSCVGSNRMGGTSKKCGCGVNRGFVGY
jgi:hypothetical protein